MIGPLKVCRYTGSNTPPSLFWQQQESSPPPLGQSAEVVYELPWRCSGIYNYNNCAPEYFCTDAKCADSSRRCCKVRGCSGDHHSSGAHYCGWPYYTAMRPTTVVAPTTVVGHATVLDGRPSQQWGPPQLWGASLCCRCLLAMCMVMRWLPLYW